MREFYAHGKLLISGEYLILDGAKGLALPTKKGQRLCVENSSTNTLDWKSYDHQNELWFYMQCTTDFKELKTSDDTIAKHLIELLKEAKEQNPTFLNQGVKANTYLEFPRAWGLGSSSTLISCIAQWASIDPYTLLKGRFKGSGYDIACASSAQPILYHLVGKTPQIEPIKFNPSFSDQLYFVYLGQKQISSEEIKAYRNLCFDKTKAIQELNELTDQFTTVTSVEDFQKLIQKHENLIATILNSTPIKELYFNDYTGAVKSLGAWGGDFALLCGDKKTPSYALEKGFDIVIPFREMVY